MPEDFRAPAIALDDLLEGGHGILVATQAGIGPCQQIPVVGRLGLQSRRRLQVGQQRLGRSRRRGEALAQLQRRPGAEQQIEPQGQGRAAQGDRDTQAPAVARRRRALNRTVGEQAAARLGFGQRQRLGVQLPRAARALASARRS
ncbi:hypothetical protein [Pseudomonas oryzihabitans]|uniref:hypothetical protein n=1 Tax=Pseudomonas oryzihabitans TaxID=47885 RepID=UPI003F5A2B5E